MNKPTPPRRFNWRTFGLLSLGIVVGVGGLLAYKMATDVPPPRPQPRDPPVTEPIAPDPQGVREEAWKRIQPRLEEAGGQTQELTNRLIHRIEKFFEDRKEGTTAFAEAALGWSSKWELIKSRQGHRKFLAEKFGEYIFSQEELAALLEEASTEYSQGMLAIENELLVTIRADLADLPSDVLPAFANEQVLRTRFDSIVNEVVADVARDLQVDVGQTVSSLVIGEVVAMVITKTLTAVATRLGVSGAVIGTGAAASWATLGAGIVIGIAVDFLLDWIIGWFHDPVGDLSAKVSSTLDDVKTSITSGDPEAWIVYRKLTATADADPDSAVRSRSAEVVINIERGGALGLKYALGRVADVQNQARNDVLRQLVFGELK